MMVEMGKTKLYEEIHILADAVFPDKRDSGEQSMWSQCI